MTTDLAKHDRATYQLFPRAVSTDWRKILTGELYDLESCAEARHHYLQSPPGPVRRDFVRTFEDQVESDASALDQHEAIFQKERDGSIRLFIRISPTPSSQRPIRSFYPANLDREVVERAVMLLKSLMKEAGSSSALRKVDEMKGVIRDVGETDVFVSLFRDDEEFCLELPRAVFEEGEIDPREDEGFYFWVEQHTDGTEKPVVKPLPTRELTDQDWKEINDRITELLDGEST